MQRIFPHFLCKSYHTVAFKTKNWYQISKTSLQIPSSNMSEETS